MPYTTPPTFVSGTALPAADLNILGDDIVYLKGIADGVGLSGFSIRRAATQSISTSTDTDISFDTELQDFGGWWSSGTTATTPAGAIPSGYTTIGVLYLAQVKWATNATGKRKMTVLLDGASVDNWKVSALDDDNTSIYLSGFTTCAAASTWKLQVWQNSGGALNVSEARLTVLRWAPAA